MSTINQTLPANEITADPGHNGQPATGVETNPPLISVPELLVTKAASTQFTYPNEVFSYTLTINNVGGAPTANPFTISDLLPAYLTLAGTPISSTGPVVNLGNDTQLNLQVSGSILPGRQAVITIPVKVSDSAAAGLLSPNQAVVTPGNGGDPATGVETSPPLVEIPAISVTKSSDANSCQPGQKFDYVIRIQNNSTVPTANPFMIYDVLPNYVTLVGSPYASSGTVTNSGDNKTLYLSVGTTINPGETFTVTLPVEIADNAPPGFVGSNVATVDPGNGGDTVKGQDKDSPVVQYAVLQASKTAAPNVIYPGGSFTYTLTIENTGNYPTTSPMQIADLLPPNVTLNGTPASPLGPVTNFGTSSNLSLSINGSLGVGESTTITIPVMAGPDTPMGTLPANVAAITAGKAGTSATDQMPPLVTIPVLNGTKSASTSLLYPGETFNYTLSFINTGAVPTANPLLISDLLPPGLTLSGTPISNGGQVINTGTSTDLQLQVNAPIMPGKSIQIILPVTLDPNAEEGTLAVNSATAQPGNGGESVTINQQTPITIETPEISVIKTATSNAAAPGDRLSYIVYIHNNSNIPTGNPFTITETLPPYVSLNGNPVSNVGPITTAQNNGSLTFTVAGSIPPGGVALISIPVIIDPGAPAGAIDNNLVVVDPGNGGETVTGEDKNPPTVQLPILMAAKTADLTQTYPGGTFNYTLEITNIGNAPTSNPFALVDQLPPNVTLAGPPASTAGNVTNFGNATRLQLIVNGQIQPDQTITITIPVKVDPNAPAGTLAPNTATIDPGNNGAATDVVENNPPVVGIPKLVVNKTANSSFLTPGETYQYVITLTNVGNVPTGNPISIQDSLPPGVTLAGTPSSTIGLVQNRGTATQLNLAVFGSLTPGETATVTLPVLLDASAGAGALDANSAVVDPGNGGQPETGSETSPPLVETPDLTITKTASVSTALPGGSFNYILTITNNSHVPTVAPYTILDNLPPYLTLSGNPTSNVGSVTNSGTDTNLQLTVTGSLAPDSVATIIVPVTISPDTPIGPLGSNTAVVYPNGPEEEGNSGTDKNPPIIQGPSLIVAKSSSVAETYPGGTFDYVITIMNQGNYPTANPITITDSLPPGTVLNGLPTSDAGPLANYGDSTNLNLSLGTSLLPGQSATIIIPVKVVSGTSLSLPLLLAARNASLDANLALVNPGNGGSPVPGIDPEPPVIIGLPDFSNTVRKTATPKTAQPGDMITYSLTATNNGETAATNFTVTDTLPTLDLTDGTQQGMTYQSQTAQATIVEANGTMLQVPVLVSGTPTSPIFTLVDSLGNPQPIPVGATVKLFFQAQVPAGAQVPATFYNTATLLGSGSPVTDGGVTLGSSQPETGCQIKACHAGSISVKCGQKIPLSLNQCEGSCITRACSCQACRSPFILSPGYLYRITYSAKVKCCYRNQDFSLALQLNGKILPHSIAHSHCRGQDCSGYCQLQHTLNLRLNDNLPGQLSLINSSAGTLHASHITLHIQTLTQ